MAKRKKMTGEEWQTYKKLMAYAVPYKARLAVGIFCGILFGGSTAGIVVALERNFRNLGDTSDLDLWKVVLIAAALPLFAVLRGVGDFTSKYLVEWVGNRVVMDLRNETFGHIHDLGLNYFTQSRTGELISRTTNDSMMVQRAVSNVIGDLIREPFVLIFMIGYLMYLNWQLSIASLVLFPICIVPVALFGRRVRRASREGHQKLADLVTILQETIAGVRIVKAFGMEEYEKERFRVRSRSVFSRLMRVAKARSAVEPIIVTISLIGLALVFLYAKWSGMRGDQLIAYAAALVAMYEPAKKLSRIHIGIQESSAGADRIFEILDTPCSVTDRPGAVELAGPIDRVEFRDVGFAYEQNEILSGVNLSARAGECIAFVGSSGAGKTTLISLIPRFYDAVSGAVLINGRDVRDYTVKSLRRQIGMVTQESILFNDTVANNIAYGSDPVTPKQIEEAARKAHAHEFILGMEQGYDTVIGEMVAKLSGGQRQRLAIARAMLRNPPILILDEATSALDTESERQVQAALDELMAHRTVFAIAHRLSTIAQANRIIVLDKGCVVESGSHAELMAKGGHYQYLYDLQFNVKKTD
ncbi:MAG: ABC transporter transmembrane domain-containing protein [Kiritimatiellae bacterium]|nr:ABC transporter transmembrane domain-containing protein [Kiritimatiellia bacterium]